MFGNRLQKDAVEQEFIVKPETIENLTPISIESNDKRQNRHFSIC